ncbi:hypothetical protein [Streptomyces echinatus]|uniref:hypothetical protein n=1 Tax=Streptomyces echinatus TaxID=67293 RepID=UPI00380F3D61
MIAWYRERAGTDGGPHRAGDVMTRAVGPGGREALFPVRGVAGVAGVDRRLTAAGRE